MSRFLPWLLLAATCLITLTGMGGYLRGRSDGVSLERGRRASDEALMAKVSEAAALGAAAEISRIRVTQTTIRQRVETEIREKPVYRNCVHDQRVYDALNSALSGTVSAGGLAVPTVDAPGGQGLRSHDEQAVRGGGDLSGLPGRSAGDQP